MTLRAVPKPGKVPLPKSPYHVNNSVEARILPLVISDWRVDLSSFFMCVNPSVFSGYALETWFLIFPELRPNLV